MTHSTSNDNLHDDAALRRAGARLPASLQPSRDLWPGIAAQITSTHKIGKPMATQRQDERPAWLPALAAAASITLVAATLWLGAVQQRDRFAAPMSAGFQTDAAGSASHVMGPDYVQARNALRSTLNQRLSQLPPETRTVVENNLQVIENSLAAINQALADDPGNSSLQGLLLSTYQTELSVLRNFSQLTRKLPQGVEI